MKRWLYVPSMGPRTYSDCKSRACSKTVLSTTLCNNYRVLVDLENSHSTPEEIWLPARHVLGCASKNRPSPKQHTLSWMNKKDFQTRERASVQDDCPKSGRQMIRELLVRIKDPGNYKEGIVCVWLQIYNARCQSSARASLRSMACFLLPVDQTGLL